MCNVEHHSSTKMCEVSRVLDEGNLKGVMASLEIHLVNEKNTLLRCESELVIQSNSIQLEDRQARLEQQIRDLLTAERKNWF